MNVTIVGGGNVGTQFAVHCAEKGHTVIIYTSKPEAFSKKLSIVDETGAVSRQGEIAFATDDSRLAFENADLIFVTVPAYCMSDTAQQIIPHVKSGAMIGLVPGTGGGECAFGECLDRGVTIFGMQRVPSVARLVEYGKTVCATGYRDELFVASLPFAMTDTVRSIISDIFDMKCLALPNYLNLTLTPSNPILHTTRLRTIFGNYYVGKTYDELPLFYEGWNDESSRLLFTCDDEVQRICKAIDGFDLSYVKSLKIHYESDTPEALTRKITSIKSFKGFKTPAVKVEEGYVPDLENRYFVADFSYGLTILKQIADLYGVSVPNIDATLAWYDAISVPKEIFQYSRFGIADKEEFEKFYNR